ncbi:aldehyde dehydrogenase family protein [Enterococcus sp.]|uniref:aldehyde dehydrogenase family protein n=1 Tax=Enterococcus sp. TaxID=35783 RepID=UPI002907D257|nr:aldehyde dehydrogenase family protein [Enterococcus sp.]MDU5335221.1 aldehyde dehydrogenase family protein [Enterococcus sp.]
MTTKKELNELFSLQRSAYSRSKPRTYEERIDSLERVDKLLRENMDQLIQALQKDFGQRDPLQIVGADLSSPLSAVPYIKKRLRKWMKPDRKKSGILGLLGTKQFIMNEPLGVVGIISPFNAPIDLAFDPAIEALAAGNRVMLKISEYTPQTTELLQHLVAQYFEPEILTVITGEQEISTAFSALPWDKLVFTGSSATGKKVMASAAKNLTPVLLELGGKNPAIVLSDADMALTAKKIARGRGGNSGQICLSVNYALVPEDKLEQYVEMISAELTTAYPTYHENPEFSALINPAAYERVDSILTEAKERGAQIIELNPNHEKMPDKDNRLFPFTLVINPDRDLRVSHEEIFGPILSIFTYNKLEEAITFINRHEKSLALYIFGHNTKQIDQILNQTSSGGVDINELSLHAGSHEMGFGGVGYSGMGRYKGGKIGFEAFSNAKAVYQQGTLAKYTSRFMTPIHNPKDKKLYNRLMGIK